MKQVIVTGAYGAIGKAIAEAIAKQPDHSVFMVGRDCPRLDQAVQEVQESTGNKDVIAHAADLSNKESIYDLAKRIEGPIYTLVNNAAACPPSRTETAAGIEVQFATNILGYVWMMEAFTQHLKLGAPSRIVNVASYFAGELQLDDLEFKQRTYDNNSAYRQSKQANRMLTVAFAEQLSSLNISVNACHPGDVNSKLSNDLGFGGSTTAAQGADTPAWLAVSTEVEQISGKYFSNRKEVHCEFASDSAGIDALYERVGSF
ncbi:MAG: SDR family NAD(P)-dependent oxidoreductase [Bacteroidetes bacterium]|nr:SDR family NAD(P)-dependent oxidoreductase [Bacteroidota bacterium]